jgi:beta-phosphoglucomutase
MPSTQAGIIFDMDGVLVDSADAHRRAWQQLGDEAGTPFSAALFQRTFGQRNASIIPQWLGGDVSDERFQQLDSRKESLYRDFARQGAVRVYPRVPELLNELRQAGASVAIASSGPRENVALLIDVIGVSGRIDAVVTAEDVRNGKPHPQAFLTAAERLRLPPARCAVIEDSVHGIEAARRAGMLAVAVLTSTPRDQLVAAGAEVMVGEVGDLSVTELLESLNRRTHR